jgi:hypothetical protein
VSRIRRGRKVTPPPDGVPALPPKSFRKGSGRTRKHRKDPMAAGSRETGDPQLLFIGLQSSADSADSGAEKLHFERAGSYEPEDIVDAPEHHVLSKALGILTWSIWDHDVRPVSERKRDFVTAFPPRDPTLFSLGGMERKSDHEWVPRARDQELERFLHRDGRANGVDSLLARYGLKLRGAGPLHVRTTPVRDSLQAARERNHALRVLHGSVDIEPKDMDAAKSAFLDQQEKRRAAEEIRAARKRLLDELKDGQD